MLWSFFLGQSGTFGSAPALALASVPTFLYDSWDKRQMQFCTTLSGSLLTDRPHYRVDLRKNQTEAKAKVVAAIVWGKN